jgi:hypothetical protein
MMATAAAQSRRLARSLRLSSSEQEDAEQDILGVMLIEAGGALFDGSRGSNVAFAIRIGGQATQIIGWDRLRLGAGDHQYQCTSS